MMDNRQFRSQTGLMVRQTGQRQLDPRDARIAELEAQLAQAQAVIAELEKQKTQFQQQIATLKERVAQLQARIAALERAGKRQATSFARKKHSFPTRLGPRAWWSVPALKPWQRT